MTQRFVLISDRVRENAIMAIRSAPDGFSVSVSEPKRSLDQNAKLHAIIGDFARSPMKWAGKTRTPDEWKILLISGHAVATERAGEVIPGLENEFVAIRESSANMGVRRTSSLIEYCIAFAATHGIELIETSRNGFMDERSSAA